MKEIDEREIDSNATDNTYPRLMVPQYQCPICEKSYVLPGLAFKCESDIDITDTLELIHSGGCHYGVNEEQEVIEISQMHIHFCGNGAAGLSLITGLVPLNICPPAK